MKMFPAAALASLCVLLLARTSQAADADVLNFALNLEYLEANFYSCAAFGTPIDQDLWGTGGVAPDGCEMAKLSPVALEYAKALAMDEIDHVKFLRTALGDAAVAQPKMNIGSAFADAADAALNTTLSPRFTAYGSDILFYHAAFILEDVGVTAYKGAAPLLENTTFLEAAAGILAVEAYHGGAIRALLLEQSEVTVFPYGAKVKDIVQSISDLRATVSGADDDEGLLKNNDGDYVLAPTDTNAIAFSRSTSQVLKIVYLGASSTQGGFYPDGLNGAITSSA